MSTDPFKEHLEKARAAAAAEAAETEPYFQGWWAMKLCERCRIVRRVRVSKMRGQQPRWRANCAACEYDLSAEQHERQAATARKRARAERERQARRGLQREPA